MRQLNRQQPEPGATTLTGLVVQNNTAWVFGIGDSRVYRLRAGVLQQLTIDDTISEYVAGQGRKSKLSAFIGQAMPPDIKPQRLMLKAGDIYLVCSDGLWNFVNQDALKEGLSRFSPATAVRQLMKLVYKQGARDNISMIIVHYAPARPSRMRWIIGGIAAAVAVVLIGIGALVFSTQGTVADVTPTDVPPGRTDRRLDARTNADTAGSVTQLPDEQTNTAVCRTNAATVACSSRGYYHRNSRAECAVSATASKNPLLRARRRYTGSRAGCKPGKG